MATLAIRDLSQRTTILTRHADGMGALFGKTRPVDGQHPAAFGQHLEQPRQTRSASQLTCVNEVLKALVGDRLVTRANIAGIDFRSCRGATRVRASVADCRSNRAALANRVRSRIGLGAGGPNLLVVQHCANSRNSLEERGDHFSDSGLTRVTEPRRRHGGSLRNVCPLRLLRC
jgi:hypothetical protein